jgi:transmembrane 9 superfamily member 2/4
MGVINGYKTAHHYKTFPGKAWQRVTLFTALVFPGLMFGLFVVLNILAWFHESTLAVPSVAMLSLLGLCICWCSFGL